MANSNVVIGKVVVLQGHAYLHTADGRQVELKLGDPVHEGDVIVTAPGAVVQLGFNDGVSYVVHQNETITLDPSVFAAKDVDSDNAALTTKGADLKQITDVIANGGDLDQLLEAPAAGLGGGGDGNSGHSFVQLVRITESTPTEGSVGNGGAFTSQADAQNSGGKTGLSGPDAQDSAASEMVGVSHEQSVTIHLTGTDSEASIASFTVLSLPTNGTLYLADGKTPVFVGEVIGASGNAANLVFTPSAGTNAVTTSFQYTATDTLGVASNVATGTINVTAAPTITVDPIHTVNGANAASSALIAVTGTVGSNVPVGDTVSLNVGGHTYTGTVQAGGTYSIGVPGNVLATAGTTNLHASVTITDAFGDTGTAVADQPYSVELNAAPISININPVATVNGAEAASSSPIVVNGTVSSNVPVGDTVTLTVDGHSYSGVVQAGGTYSIGIPGNILGSAGSGSIVATVSSTDAAGNTANASASQAYGVELTAPPIAVSINPISTVNGAEASSSSPIAITGVVTSTAGGPIAGDTVTVSVGGQSYTGTVQSDGTYSVGVPGSVLANAPSDSIHVTVSGTDPVGNVATASANQAYNVELTAPPIAISIDTIGTINHATLQQGQINISGNVTSNAGGPIAGDTVTLTVGGQTYTGTVQANGSYSISVSTSVLANAPVDSVHATVSGVDPAGNVATASADQGYGVELNAAPIAVSINSIGTISTAEAASSNPVMISGVVTGSGPIAGDTVVLSVGGQSYTATVQSNGSYTVNVPGNVLGGASSDVVSVSVSGTDSAGNVASASASQSYTVASSSGASTLNIGVDPIATVNGAEATSSSPIAITGTVTGTGSASIQGDVVTLTVGGQSYAGTVLSNGTYSIGVPGNVLAGATTDSVHVSVSGTDSASNPLSASADQAYNVELTAPPIAVSINTIGTISVAEAASSSPVAISGVVTSTSGGPIAGDTVTLTVGGQTYTSTVLANGTYSISVPGNVLGGAATDTVQVSVSGTDAAHNVATASASQSYTVASSSGASTLSIGVDPIATVNGAEAASSSPIAITGTVTGTGSASIQGDVVTLTVGGQSYTGAVGTNGSYSIGVPGNVLAGATTDSVHVSVSGTDSASNPLSASTDQAYNVELTAPPIAVSINTIGTISAAEAASSSAVAISGVVTSTSGGPIAGDTVTLTVGGQTYTGTVLANGTYSINVPGNVLGSAATDTVQVSVSGTDAAHNVATANASQSYTVATNGTPSTLSIGVDPIATVNGAEAASSSPIAITGTVTGTGSASISGDTVTLTVGGQSYTGTVGANGTYSIGVPGNVLAGATTDSVHVSVSGTDSASNPLSASADQAYNVELTAPPIAVSINTIGTISVAEAASNSAVAISGAVTSTSGGPISGDTVTLTVGGQTYTGTVLANGTYSINVPGNVLGSAATDTVQVSVSGTDAAHNVATASASQSYTVATPSTLNIGVDPIATVNGAEAASSSPIAITGTVTGTGSASISGDTVTLTVGGQSYTGTVGTNGTYSIGVPGNVLAGATTDSVHVSVSGSDSASNPLSASADQAYNVELTAPPIAVSINTIGTISVAEAASSSAVAISGVVTSTSGGPISGDAVTLTVGGQTYTGTVLANGTYSINVPGNVLGSAATDTVQVLVSGTDAAHNVATASASQSYTVATPSTLSIGVDPITTVNGAEAASSSPIAITGTVTGTGSASISGDTVTLTVGGQSYTGTVGTNGTYSIGVPGNVLAGATTDSVHVSVSGSDSASNPLSASADQAYNVELTAPPIAVSINTIGTISTAEAASSSAVAISGVVTSTSGGPIAGDTVTLTVGGQTYTGTVLANGTYSINVPGNVLGSAATDTVQVSVSGTDAAHNVATANASQSYTVATNGTPSTLSIGVDPIATVNGAEAASSSPIAITGMVTGTGSASISGDTVTLTVGGQSYTGTVGTNGAYSIGVPGNVLAGATTDSVHVSVSGTDSASNPLSASADQAYNVELTAPPIAVSINTIGTISVAEAASSSAVAISGVVTSTSGGPISGDTVTLTVGGQTYTGTVLANGTYSINVPGNVLGSAATDTVQVTVSGTDAAHNVATASASQSYTVATPSTLSIGVDPIATVNGAEAASSSLVAITGTVTGTGSASVSGDTVTLTVGGQSYTGTVGTNGTYSIGVPGNVLAGATTDSVHVSVSGTDSASNPLSASADQAYSVELTAPPISISVNSIATINGAEAASSASIAITGSVSANVPTGDVVTLTVDGHSYTGTVLPGGTYNIGVPGNILAGASTDSVHVTVSTTDAAGNTATASADQAYNVELAAAPISISVNQIATINGAEAASSASIAITGSVSANVPTGDVVTLTIDGHSYTGTVLPGGTYNIGVPGNVLAGASTDSVHVTVSTTDAAGNTATASADQAYNVELAAAPISISVNQIATINGAEAASSASIAITGSVSANVPTGDVVTLTVDGHSYTGTVLPGGTYNIGVPGNVLAGASTDSVHVTVSTTDAAGNTATASADQAYNVELTAAPISISVNQIATINGAEAASSAPIAITGSVSANVPTGDTVTLTVDGHSYTGTVNNGAYSISVPGNVLAGASTDSVHVTVSTTDAAGNTATASADQAYNVELTAAPISISVNSIATINGAEAASSAPIAITGSVSANVPTGDTVTLTVAGQTYTGTVSNGTYSIPVPGNVLAGASTDSVHVTVSTTDAAGNTATASADQAYNVELTAAPISISVNSIATINGAEAASSAPIAITGSVSANVPTGDTVTLTVDGHSYTGTVNNGAYSISVPGNVLAGASTDSVHVTVSTTDAAGNTATASADQAYNVELTAAPISISVNQIATINSAEATSGTPIAITGSVSNNVPTGDTVTLTVAGHTYTGTVQSNGTYDIPVPANILAGASTDSVHVTVSTTDAAGNTATASADQGYAVDLNTPDTPGVAINPSANGVINAPELGASTSVHPTVTLDAAGQTLLSNGGTVQININDNGAVQSLNLHWNGTSLVDGSGNGYAYSNGVITLTAAAPGDGNTIKITATETDVNGNVSNQASATAVEITTPLSIAVNINQIGVINHAEGNSNNPIAITGTVSSTDGGPIAGDTITLTVGGQSYTGTVQLNGTYSISVPGSILASASTDTVQVSVSGTDSNGNIATASASQTYGVDLTVPDAPTVAIPVANSSGIITHTALGSATTVAVTVTLDSADQTVLNNQGSVQININDNGATQALNLHMSGSNLVDSSGNIYAYSGGVITLNNEAAPGNGNTIKVSSTVTDQYGNVSSPNSTQAMQETTLPDAPTVAIPLANTNGVITANALGAATTVAATVTLDNADQTILSNHGSVQITIKDNGATQVLNLQMSGSNLVDGSGNPYVYSNGVITLNNEAAPGNGNTIKVSATVTDQYGNVSASNFAQATQETTLPDAPTVAIPVANSSGFITNAALGTATTVAATVTLDSADQTILSNQGSVQININDNGATQALNLHMSGSNLVDGSGNIYAYSGGVITLNNEAAPGNGNTIKVSSTVTDQYGNVSASNATQATEEITVPDAPAVVIPLANAGGYITKTALNGAASIAVTVTLDSADQTALSHGGSVQINVNDNGATQALNLQMSGSNLVDGAGNTYVYSGGVITLSENAPGDGNTIKVTSTVTDQYGNVSASTITQATEEITLPDAPIVTIPLANGSGYITETALNNAAKIAVNIALDSTDQADLSHGGSVQINVNDNGALQALNLHMSGSNLVDGSGNIYAYSGGVITLSENAPGNGNTIKVSSTVTDQYTNVSGSSSAQATQESTLPDAPVVTIPLANSGGYITQAALNGAAQIAVNVALDSTDQNLLSHGGSVQINVNDNGALQTLNLQMSGSNLVDGSGNTYVYSGGVITLSEAAPGNGNTITVSSTVTDQYTNVSGSTSTHATEETTVPPAPTTQITTDTNQDGYISAAELNGSSSVNATVTLSTAAQSVLTSGGSVQVTVVDAGATTNLNLHMSNGSLVDGSGNSYSYSGGVIGLTENAPGNGKSISVSATITDTYGNVSPVSNIAAAQQDVIDSPAVSIAFGTPTSSNLVLDTWVNNATVNGLLYTSAGNNGDGTNPGTLINTLTSTAVAPTASTTTTLINGSVTAGTATEISGLVYLQAGHTYTFSGTEDDSFAMVIGGKLVGSTTWGINSGVFSGTFAASASGWYTLAAYHDNQSGPGQFNVNVSDNGATAVALNSTNFDLAPSVAALNSAGIALNAEMVTSTTSTITTTASNSSGAGTVKSNLTGGYYTEKPIVDVTLDSSDQNIINNGGTLNVVGSDGTNVTLHWNGSSLVDSTGNTYNYSNGVLALPLNATPTTSMVSASATVYDTHSVPSLTTTTHEIYSGSNSITEVVGGDTFKFELAANGPAGTPNVETLSAFNSNPVGNGGDVLNLADLLQGATSSNIGNYLHFTASTSGGVTTTTVHVSETGAYASGYSAAADTLQIALTGANLLMSGGATQTDAQIIQALLNKGKLVE